MEVGGGYGYDGSNQRERERERKRERETCYLTALCLCSFGGMHEVCLGHWWNDSDKEKNEYFKKITLFSCT